MTDLEPGAHSAPQPDWWVIVCEHNCPGVDDSSASFIGPFAQLKHAHQWRDWLDEGSDDRSYRVAPMMMSSGGTTRS